VAGAQFIARVIGGQYGNARAGERGPRHDGRLVSMEAAVDRHRNRFVAAHEAALLAIVECLGFATYDRPRNRPHPRIYSFNQH